MKAGTFNAKCDFCQGAGTVKFGTRPAEVCPKCDGAGELTINGERHGDKRNADMRSTMKATLFWLSFVLLSASVGILIAIWRLNH